MTHNFDDIRVRDYMHAGVVSCSPDTPLDEVARMMAGYRVHAIAIADIGHGRPWGTWRIVSDMDVMAAIGTDQQPKARQVATREAITISADQRIDRAAKVMSEHGVAHLVVTEPEAGYPVGIISTLDVAAAFGEGEHGGVPASTE